MAIKPKISFNWTSLKRTAYFAWIHCKANVPFFHLFGDKNDIMIHGFAMILLKFTSSQKVLFSTKLGPARAPSKISRKWKVKLKRVSSSFLCAVCFFIFVSKFSYLSSFLFLSTYTSSYRQRIKFETFNLPAPKAKFTSNTVYSNILKNSFLVNMQWDISVLSNSL